jgi:flagellar basal body-associated protein FliL
VWYEFEIPKKKKGIISSLNISIKWSISQYSLVFLYLFAKKKKKKKKKKGKQKPIKPIYKRFFRDAGNPI